MSAKLWSPYPNRQQELLLKTCLLEGDAALASWNEWRALVTVDELDLATQRLLPLAHQNLAALGVDHPDLERYSSVARYVWYENQLRVRLAVTLLAAFDAAEIPVMVLKGYAIAPLYYKNWGLRAASDIDILVPPPFAAKASRLLRQNGWASPDAEQLESASYRVAIHAATFKDSQGTELDLHWRALNERCDEEADDGFWTHAQSYQLNAVKARTLSDTDHLLHTIVHAMRPNAVSPIRWIADSAMILRSSEIDWPRFLKQVDEGRFGLRIRRGLTYLKDRFLLPIPESVFEALASMPHSRIEAIEEWLSREGVPPVLRLAGWRYMHYRRIAGIKTAPQSFPSYLQALWGAPTPMATVKKGIDFIVGSLVPR